MTRDKQGVIRLMAEILAGLQVPLSVGVPLGAAREPIVRLRDELSTHGYPNADEFEERLSEILAEDWRD